VIPVGVQAKEICPDVNLRRFPLPFVRLAPAPVPRYPRLVAQPFDAPVEPAPRGVRLAEVLAYLLFSYPNADCVAFHQGREVHTEIQANPHKELDGASTSNGALAVGANGARIVPGDSSRSRLYRKIIGSGGGLQMPPTGPLSQEQVGRCPQMTGFWRFSIWLD